MTIEIRGLEREPHDGVLVVVDVFRAFTTAAQAFASGAREIRCVEDTNHALRLKAAAPEALLIGEDRGVPPEGFDLGNSPVALESRDLTDRTVIQRTSNGTRGLAWIDAPIALAASAANASATAAWILSWCPSEAVRIVATHPAGEDAACAEYIARLLEGRRPDPERLAAEIERAATGALERWRELRGEAGLADYAEDLERCAHVDWSGAAMLTDTIDDEGVITIRQHVLGEVDPPNM